MLKIEKNSRNWNVIFSLLWEQLEVLRSLLKSKEIRCPFPANQINEKIVQTIHQTICTPGILASAARVPVSVREYFPPQTRLNTPRVYLAYCDNSQCLHRSTSPLSEGSFALSVSREAGHSDNSVLSSQAPNIASIC